MTKEAMEARKSYGREYRERNRDRINRQRREWRARNRELVRAQKERYWERKAESIKAAEGFVMDG